MCWDIALRHVFIFFFSPPWQLCVEELRQPSSHFSIHPPLGRLSQPNPTQPQSPNAPLHPPARVPGRRQGGQEAQVRPDHRGLQELRHRLLRPADQAQAGGQAGIHVLGSNGNTFGCLSLAQERDITYTIYIYIYIYCIYISFSSFSARFCSRRRRRSVPCPPPGRGAPGTTWRSTTTGTSTRPTTGTDCRTRRKGPGGSRTRTDTAGSSRGSLTQITSENRPKKKKKAQKPKNNRVGDCACAAA